MISEDEYGYDFMAPTNHASAISRPPFRYHPSQGFTASFNNSSSHHARDPVLSLHEKLHHVPPPPVLTKKGLVAKRQPPPRRDESFAWYGAQLVHYGLDGTGTGEGLSSVEHVKKKLVEEFKKAGGVLKVPERIKKLEKEMVKLYEEANVRAKADYEEEEQRKFKEEKEKKKKRKVEEDQLIAELLGGGSGGEGSKSKKTNAKFDQKDLTGTYKVIAPSLTDQYPLEYESEGLLLTFILSTTSSHLWASFDFGSFSGVLRSSRLPSPHPKTFPTISFTWRGRESGEGEMDFDSKNIASITFLGDGKIKGSMYWDCLGTFEFAGKKEVKGRKLDLREVKEEFRGINEESYNCASSNRWGGWTRYENKKKREKNSDTEEEGSGEDEGEESADDHSGPGASYSI